MPADCKVAPVAIGYSVRHQRNTRLIQGLVVKVGTGGRMHAGNASARCPMLRRRDRRIVQA
jgi:hypothetical protein